MLAASCGLGVGGRQPSEASRRPFGYTGTRRKAAAPGSPSSQEQAGDGPGGPARLKKLTGWSRGSSCNSGE